MAQLMLTDAERAHRPAVRAEYRFWLDFDLNLKTRTPRYRRWFRTLEARNDYVLNLPATCTVVDHGEEPCTDQP